MVLGDVELFIVSWIILLAAGTIFVIQEMLIVREVRRTESLNTVRNPSIILLMMFIALILVGIIIDLMNVIPISSYDDETAIFRIIRPSFGVLSVMLIAGSVCMYYRRQIPLGIKSNESVQPD